MVPCPDGAIQKPRLLCNCVTGTGKGGITPRISTEPSLICSGNGLIDRGDQIRVSMDYDIRG